MARQVFVFEKKKRKKRKGVHAKSKTSNNIPLVRSVPLENLITSNSMLSYYYS